MQDQLLVDKRDISCMHGEVFVLGTTARVPLCMVVGDLSLVRLVQDEKDSVAVVQLVLKARDVVN